MKNLLLLTALLTACADPIEGSVDESVLIPPKPQPQFQFCDGVPTPTCMPVDPHDDRSDYEQELLGSRPVDALLHSGQADAVAARGGRAFTETLERVLSMWSMQAAPWCLASRGGSNGRMRGLRFASCCDGTDGGCLVASSDGGE